MSEEAPESAKAVEAVDGEEPSMEDILESIRRILSEKEEEELAAAVTGAGLDMDLSAEPEPEPEPKPEPEPEPDPEPILAQVPPPMPSAMEDVLKLTPEMILIDDAGKDMTIEGMVREMLKPLLREWLDRNLPYLIERLVKKEINTMTNRAEKLSD